MKLHQNMPLDQQVTKAEFIKHTPMMQQYLRIKADYPAMLVFYRMGDFYELFFEDAEKASRILGITLTARGTSGGNPIKMAGVPFHCARSLLGQAGQAGRVVRDLRADRRPGPGQGAGRAQGRARGHAGHADRCRPAAGKSRAPAAGAAHGRQPQAGDDGPGLAVAGQRQALKLMEFAGRCAQAAALRLVHELERIAPAESAARGWHGRIDVRCTIRAGSAEWPSAARAGVAL